MSTQHFHIKGRVSALSIARLLADAYSESARDKQNARRSFLDGWHGVAAGGTDKAALREGAILRSAICDN